jgi:hypothetical protein
MGVAVDRVAEAVGVATTKVDVAAMPRSPVPYADSGMYAIDPRANDSFIAVNRLLKAGQSVYRVASPLTVDGLEWPSGTFVVAESAEIATRLVDVAAPLGVKIGVVDSSRALQMKFEGLAGSPLRLPRIGVYHAWGGNRDEGWTRWLLEQFEFPYTSVFDRDVRGGNLRAKYDVILLPDATYDEMLNGQTPRTLPDAYAGGMTAGGVSHLVEFVAAGGTLVAMDRASELPLAAFGAPLAGVKNVTAGGRASDFYVPGSILRLRVDTSNPVAYGMPRDSAAFFIHSPAFAVGSPSTGIRVVAEYPARDVLMSGWVLGERTIAGRAAVIEASIEKGRVVLLGFRTQHRGQPHGTFKLLFNSILRAGAT